MNIFPACLPLKQRTSRIGFHSGWSDPVPFHILMKYAPGFTKVFRDFFKQVHYRMDILEKCEDANKLAISGGDVEFPTNTYYPPGKLHILTRLAVDRDKPQTDKYRIFLGQLRPLVVVL